MSAFAPETIRISELVVKPLRIFAGCRRIPHRMILFYFLIVKSAYFTRDICLVHLLTFDILWTRTCTVSIFCLALSVSTSLYLFSVNMGACMCRVCVCMCVCDI